jgi:copper chaperone NosL
MKFFRIINKQYAPVVALLLLALLALVGLAGCSAQQSLDEPPEIRFDVDVCDQCGMIISEPRFAASYVTTAGDVRKFESIGDMLVYHLREQEEVHLFWVHDYYSDEWLRGDEALYVLSEQIVTPMGDNVLGTADQIGADRLVAEGGGMIVDFEQLMTLAESGSLASHGGSGHSE